MHMHPPLRVRQTTPMGGVAVSIKELARIYIIPSVQGNLVMCETRNEKRQGLDL